MANLSELNISGMSGLKIFDISNSSVEKIICDDPAALTSLVNANVSGCRLDLSEGTPEREFVDAVAEITADKDDIIEAAPDLMRASICRNQTVMAGDANMFLMATITPYVGDSPGDRVYCRS